ncbi:MAG TPA: polysaccharide biosynthesis C-terminal domain-containing protein [Luteibaculaceae bacterium]|nr:polysaccharide biosynthesis C-terminal domain-containing protein [Luteibaculaceae bacterium]
MVKNMPWSTLFYKLGGAAAGLAAAVWISATMNAAGRGEQAMYVFVFSLVSIVCQVGSASLVYLASRFDVNRLLIQSVALSAVGALFSAALLFVFPVSSFQLVSLVLTGLLAGIWNAKANACLGLSQIKDYNQIAIIQPLSLLWALISAYYLGLKSDMNTFIYCFILSNAITSLYSFYIVKFTSIHSGEPQYRNLIKHGGYIQLANLLQALKYRVHYLLIATYIGNESLGIFANAMMLIEAIWLISRSYATQHLSETANTGMHKDIRVRTKTKTWESVAFTALACALVYLIPENWLLRVFGSDFKGISDIFAALIPGAIGMAAGNQVAHYFSGTGKNHVNTLTSALGLVLVAGMSWLLIPRMGIWGACWASGLGFGVVAVVLWITFYSEKSTKMIHS